MGELTTFRFVVEGLALVFIGIFGLVGNLSGILWFSRKIIQRNFHQLMLSLALCDIVYVLLSIFLFGLPSIFTHVNKTSTYNHLVPVLLPVAQMCLTGSIYLTLAIAMERYTTVCHPFFKVSHLWTARMYILPILGFAVIYNSPKFFELKVITEVSNSSSSNFSNVTSESQILEPNQHMTTRIRPTPLRLEPLYIRFYLIYANLVIHGVTPLVLLIALNIAIYRQIRRLGSLRRDGSLHQREVRLAQVSCGIVAVFILCHSVKWIPNIYELVQVEDGKGVAWPPWIEYVTCSSHLLTTLNSSVNFYIYLFKHMRRREETGRQFSCVVESTELKVFQLKHDVIF